VLCVGVRAQSPEVMGAVCSHNLKLLVVPATLGAGTSRSIPSMRSTGSVMPFSSTCRMLPGLEHRSLHLLATRAIASRSRFIVGGYGCLNVRRVVFERLGGRRVIFTCFHPEVCVALHLKQAAFPVLLLTEGNPPPANYDDKRCKTLPAALACAINEGLQVSFCVSVS
jgi:hypothetical protein